MSDGNRLQGLRNLLGRSRTPRELGDLAVHASFALTTSTGIVPSWGINPAHLYPRSIIPANLDPNALAPRTTKKYQYTEHPKKRKENEDGRVIGFLETLKKEKSENE